MVMVQCLSMLTVNHILIYYRVPVRKMLVMHLKVSDAIKAQVDKFIHYTPAYMYHESAVKLSKKLCEIAPGNFEKRVTFGLSGSDANDGVIKFARAYTDVLILLALLTLIMDQHLAHYLCPRLV